MGRLQPGHGARRHRLQARLPIHGRSQGTLRIVHLSTYDVLGGAALVAYRLHSGLRRLGHQSVLYVQERRSEDATVAAFRPPADLRARLRRRLRRLRIERDFAMYRRSRPSGLELFSDDRSRHGADVVEQVSPCDVVNLHWIAGFVDYQEFLARTPRGRPIVWSLADMNPFTGGCHYDQECGRFAAECGMCPQLGSGDPGDLSHRIWARKHRALRTRDPSLMHIVVPGQWMADQVSRSSLFGRYPVTVIPTGIDVEAFAPRDPHWCRAVLGIPPEAKVMLFVADVVTNVRKGFVLLQRAVAALPRTHELYLLSLGHGRPTLDLPIAHLHLGHIGHERLLSMVYSAADVLVLPSLQDNFPNTALESMACGTPVVGFAVGGVPDIVQPGVTGFLAARGDVTALTAMIQEALNHPERRLELGRNCRRRAMDRYAQEVQARQYVELYQRLCAEASLDATTLGDDRARRERARRS